MKYRQTHRVLIGILVLSVLLRIIAALYFGDTVPPRSDELSYSTLAERLLTGHGFSFPVGWYPFTAADTPTSHWSFLYTGLVAAIYAVVGPHPLGARLVGAILGGILLPWLTYRLTRRLQTGSAGSSAGPTAGRPGRSSILGSPDTLPLLAAFLAAIYAYFILYAAYVQTEMLFICALLWSLERALALLQALRNTTVQDAAALSLRSWLVLGLALGVTTLLRQSILPWIAVMFLYLLWEAWRVRHQPARRSALLGLFTVPVVVLICIAPFTLRNYRVYGDFLLLNSNAGFAMYAAQHPLHGTSFGEYRNLPLPEDLAGEGLNEAQWDKVLMRRGIGFVLAEPGRYLLLSLSRVRDLFEFWPTPDSSRLFNVGRVLSIGVLLPFMLAGIYLALTAQGRKSFDRSSSLFLFGFMVFYSVLHILTWAMSRYRLPVDAVALPFAALALRAALQRLMTWRTPAPSARPDVNEIRG